MLIVVLTAYKIIVIISIFLMEKHVLRMHEDFTLEIELTALKNGGKMFIMLLENLIEYHFAHPWFQLVEQLVFHNHVWILFKSVRVKFLHSLEDDRWESAIFYSLIEFDQPLVEFVLLDHNNFVRSQVLDQLLERAHHVAKEAHSDHFDHNDIQVFDNGVPVHVTIANGRKRGDDPINARYVNTREVKLLNTTLIVIIYPSLILLQQIVADEAPETSKQVWNHA